MHNRPELPKRFRRQHTSRPAIVFVTLIALLALALAYFAGVYWGAPMSVRTAGKHTRLTRAFSEQSEKNAQLRTRVAFLEQSLALSKQSEAATREALIDQKGKLVQLQRKLDFYEGIVTKDTQKAAVKIAGLQIIPTSRSREYRFQIVLVHTGGERGDSVSGVCHIVISGSQDGKKKRLALSAISSRDAGPMEFALRYFRNLGGAFRLPAGFTPEEVDISISTGGEETDLTSSYSWEAFGG